MQRFEYCLVLEAKIERLPEKLNALGADGWEAVGFGLGMKMGITKGEHAVLLKRPIDDVRAFGPDRVGVFADGDPALAR